jgi:SAM-dependent methyltransferase
MPTNISGSIAGLRETAPTAVHDAIARNYDLASTGAVDYYMFHGHGSDYAYNRLINSDGSFSTISAQNIIGCMVERSAQRAAGEGFADPVAVLDVGTGVGGVLNEAQRKYDNRVSLTGITAFDYREDEQVPEQTYIVGNAEYPSSFFEPNSQDVIVSKTTLEHIADPLGTLEELYQILKPGGVLITSGFELPGVEKHEIEILTTMARQGVPLFATHNYSLDRNGLHVARFHKVTGDSGFDFRCMLALRKPDPSMMLRPPIDYAIIQDNREKATYSPMGNLATVRLSAQDAMQPVGRDLDRFSPRLLADLDAVLFGSMDRLYHPSDAEAFLRLWYGKLGNPAINSPAWRTFEHGIRTVFNTVLNGPAVHQAVGSVLGLTGIVRDSSPCGALRKWDSS